VPASPVQHGKALSKADDVAPLTAPTAICPALAPANPVTQHGEALPKAEDVALLNADDMLPCTAETGDNAATGEEQRVPCKEPDVSHHEDEGSAIVHQVWSLYRVSSAQGCELATFGLC
jgi:hypothetical protein